MQNKGFTLIELLVAIAIIGVLFSIVFAIATKEPSPEQTPKERCQWFIEMRKIDEIPAGCLQFVEVPDWYVELQKSKSN